MPKTDKIDALISTVRELNHRVRPILTDEIGGGEGNRGEVHTIIGKMRDRELLASHGVKRIVLSNREGVDATEIQNMMGTAGTGITLDEALEIYDEHGKLPTRVVMSEFASAREAILSLVRELPETSWEAVTTQTIGDGLNSVDAIVDDLNAKDKQDLAKINELLAITA